jgi:hypothetical protein
MSNSHITLVVAAVCGVFGIAIWIGLFVVPAWQSYSRMWERLAATFLTLYVLAALLVLGGLGGAAIFYYWDEITGLAAPLGLR